MKSNRVKLNGNLGGGEEVEEEGDENSASNEEITTGVTCFPAVASRTSY